VQRTFAPRGLGYSLVVPELAIEFNVDRLSRTRGELHGELSVTCGLPGTRSVDGHLHNARFNLSGGTSRGTLAKTLAKRSAMPDIDWEDLLEDFCRRVMGAERTGDPVIDVGALPVPVDESYRLAPILPLGQTTILYGEGGTGKSTLSCLIAVATQTGIAPLDGWVPRKAPVLYLDWEGGKDSINRRVRGVAMGMHCPSPVTIRYLDCRRRGALWSFAEDIARMVDLEGYGLVIVDSVGMASGTSSEGSDANESAIRLFSAFGYLGTTVLADDHVSKAETEATNRPARPYGSIYKTNLARATYELRRQKTADGSSVLLLLNTKANDADTLPPQAIRVVHEDGAIRYEPTEISAEVATEARGRLTQADRLAAFLTEGHLTDAQLSDLSEIPEKTIRTVLSRHKTRFGRLPSGAWELLPEVRTHAS
jgi:hypothetical protein